MKTVGVKVRVADAGLVRLRNMPIQTIKAEKEPVLRLGPIVVGPDIGPLEKGGPFEFVVLTVGGGRTPAANTSSKAARNNTDSIEHH